LLKDISVTAFRNIYITIIGLLISIIVTRLLGPEKKGIYIYAILIINMVSSFSIISLNTAIPLLISSGDNLNKILKHILLYSIVLVPAGMILSFILLKNNIANGFLIFFILNLPLQYFSQICDDIWLSNKKMLKTWNYIPIIKKSLFLLLLAIPLWISSHNNLTLILLIFSICTFINAMISYVFIKKAFKIEASKIFSHNFEFSYLLKMLKIGAILFLINYSYKLITNTDIFFLKILTDNMSVGLYSTGLNIVGYLALIQNTILPVMLSYLISDNTFTRNKFVILNKISFIINLLLGTVLLIFSKTIIVFLYGTQFVESVIILRILIFGIIINSFGQFYIVDFISRLNKKLTVVYINIFVLLINCLLNYFFIKKMGWIGAAWASLLSYSVRGLLMTILYSKYSGIKMLDLVLLNCKEIVQVSNTLKGANILKHSIFRSKNES